MILDRIPREGSRSQMAISDAAGAERAGCRFD